MPSQLKDNSLRGAAATLFLALLLLIYFVNKDHWGAAERDGPRAPPSAQPAQSAQTAAPLSVTFDKIYEGATWGTNEAGVGHSGTGSTMALTVVYRAFLQAFLKDNDIHSVVDAGCGDWEFSKAIDWSTIDYRGYDIVASVVEKDNKLYGNPHTKFFVANVVDDDLPPADLLIVKHVLQHLPNEAVLKFLRQLPKYKHVLLTNGVDPKTLTAPNIDIPAGHYRDIDLLRPPFNLPAMRALLYNDGFNMHEVLYWKRPSGSDGGTGPTSR